MTNLSCAAIFNAFFDCADPSPVACCTSLALVCRATTWARFAAVTAARMTVSGLTSISRNVDIVVRRRSSALTPALSRDRLAALKQLEHAENASHVLDLPARV